MKDEMNLTDLRRAFPHTEDGIYLNHAATGPLSRPVMAAIERHTAARHRTNVENFETFMPIAEETRGLIAQMLGTEAARVDFTPNTSYGLNILTLGLDWKPGDRVAVPDCEFPANVYPFMALKRFGVEVDLIETRNGTFTLDDVVRVLTPRTRVLTVSWVQFLSGFRADLEALGALCRTQGVLFCVDAIQGLGALRLGDGAGVDACGIDFLASGAHKWLMSTQGVGFFYVSEALQARLTPTMVGWLNGPVDWEHLSDYALAFHDDATRFRLGTLNSIGITALHAALEFYFENDPIWCEEQILAHAARLADGFDRLGLERFGSDDPAQSSGIISVRVPEPEAAFEALKARQVRVAVRNRMLRFAPSYYHTPEDIDTALDHVARLTSTQVGV